MKYLSFLLFALLIGFNTSSQTVTKDTLKIVIKPKIAKGLSKQEIVIPLVNTDTSLLKDVDIKSEFWDTVNFNPYRNSIVKFPLNITFSDTTYAAPIKKKKVITSRYGWRRGRPHRGIDIDLVTGDTVVSMLDGIVRFARYSQGHGKVVVVRHYNGLETAYAHLSSINVKPNDTVSKGQFLGKGGNTGRSTGSHLHLVTSYRGQYIHPEYLFDFSSENRIRAKELWVTKEWTRASFYNARKKPKLKLYTTEKDALASHVKTRKVYVVKSGDTLSRISKRNNVSIAAICKTNSIRKTSTLRVGQKLILEL
ncbi:murein DD-endopeptidase MepM/ murein hydrolase activator NlpD [Winogradskyella wandonensis]|uniref:Murein DD-endopeptidase MepM/ murein hydrolase activator NlpD n=1 Tax=Winogradskyella wandonensis TaxID=1442586 RepID=A0A4R1KVR5_9FLAO|nr:peptidoglycan DD-metalloendopeptidase family protein [Winogradskyella wandonensis]TCK69286.1 murein DD-endopeptidase MepM/ murein hydrolase activator NlpD [Winogradskyella wandonensis]